MEILAALFIDAIDVRSVEGPAARLDLTGVQFSGAAPGPAPVTVEPHLCVIIHCPVGARETAALEVTFRRSDDPETVVARNVQPLQVEAGKFNYRLIRAELTFETLGTIEAHCRLDMGPATVVPYTLLPPVP